MVSTQLINDTMQGKEEPFLEIPPGDEWLRHGALLSSQALDLLPNPHLTKFIEGLLPIPRPILSGCDINANTTTSKLKL